MLNSIRRHFSRPFSAAHWSLGAGLLALWVLVAFGIACRQAPYYLELALATVTVCLALWTSHCKVGQAVTARAWLKILMLGILDILHLFILIILFGMPILLISPSVHCYTTRAKIFELILHASSYKTAVAENIAKNRSLANASDGIRPEASGLAKFISVTSDGTIVVGGEEPPAVIILSPALVNDTVHWNCRGYPEKHMPMSCRTDPQK